MSDYPPCTHPREGIVTTHPRSIGLFDEVVLGAHAATNVCADAACIADAIRWAERTSGKSAHYVADAERVQS